MIEFVVEHQCLVCVHHFFSCTSHSKFLLKCRVINCRVNMPRQSRIDAPDALHHIMVREIERREIFRDNKDKDNFVERLGNIIKNTSTS